MEASKNIKSRRIISWPLEYSLRVFGIWPGVSYSLHLKMFWLILMICNTGLQLQFIIFHASSRGFLVFVYAFVGFLRLAMKVVKLIIFWYNQRKFYKMWETMSMNWVHGDTFATALDKVNKTQISHYLPDFIVMFHMFAAVMTSFSTIVDVIRYDETSNATRLFIIPMQLPFDNIRYSVYLLIIFQQFFYLVIFSAGTTTINSILIISMMYLGDQIDIICRSLREMPSNKHKENEFMIKKVIKKHQCIITFSKNIESIYTYIVMSIVVPNALMTCGLAFLLVTSIGSKTFVKVVTKNILFLCVTNIETFIFCFAGEYLSIKSRTIGKAAYSSPWYQSKIHSRSVLFIILRSQRQLTITVGKFADLSLELFSTIVKASMSYLSVLLAIY